MIAFVVPGAPVGKGRPRATAIGGRARLYTPAKTVAYEGLVAMAAREAMAGRPLLEGAVALNVHVGCPIPASWSRRKQAQALAGEVMPTTKPDASNIVKAVEDGLNGVAWRDDVQIVDLQVRKRYSAVPCVRVEAWSLAQPLPEAGPRE